MQKISYQWLYIFYIGVTAFLIYLLGPILTPFLLGALLAYLSDPLVKRLEKKHIPHLLSVTIVFTLLLVFFLVLILSLLPLIQTQIESFIQALPGIIATAQDILVPFLRKFISWDSIQTSMSTAVPKAAEVVKTVVSSSYTVIEWAVNIVLTPVITFYLLRDWDKLCNAIKGLLPTRIKPTVLDLMSEYDRVLGEFFRGQLLIMFALALIYGIGLSMAGLQIGLVIGLIGGLLSIVPYLGSFFVVATASIAAAVQYGLWEHLLWVWLVFLIGQGVEGYILTPYLIGNRIGLHPVAVIFAIMAGGTLFGFFGVLLALPVAALIVVLFRYARKKHFSPEKYMAKKA